MRKSGVRHITKCVMSASTTAKDGKNGNKKSVADCEQNETQWM